MFGDRQRGKPPPVGLRRGVTAFGEKGARAAPGGPVPSGITPPRGNGLIFRSPRLPGRNLITLAFLSRTP